MMKKVAKKMNVSGKVILEKMESEIKRAKRESADRESYLRRIANVKVLCELLLDESTSTNQVGSRRKPTAEEVEQMMKGPQSGKSDGEVEHNPESIFDF